MNASEEALTELAAKIKFDPEDLDVEIISQANYYWHAAGGYALAVSLRDKAKNDLEVAEAELNLLFRREATDKTTEPQLKAMVTASDLRLELFDKYIAAKLMADRWLALRDSFTARGYALRDLDQDRRANYFGERAIPASDRNEAEKRFRDDHAP
jgi:hypothetical protein